MGLPLFSAIAIFVLFLVFAWNIRAIEIVPVDRNQSGFPEAAPTPETATPAQSTHVKVK